MVGNAKIVGQHLDRGVNVAVREVCNEALT
jgi:hypothetical protein